MDNLLGSLQSKSEGFLENTCHKYKNLFLSISRINKKLAYELFSKELEKGNPIAKYCVKDMLYDWYNAGYKLSYHYISTKILPYIDDKYFYLTILATDIPKLQRRLKNRQYRKNDKELRTITGDIINTIINNKKLKNVEKIEGIEFIMSYMPNLNEFEIDLLLQSGFIKDLSLFQIDHFNDNIKSKLAKNNKICEEYYQYRSITKEDLIKGETEMIKQNEFKIIETNIGDFLCIDLIKDRLDVVKKYPNNTNHSCTYYLKITDKNKGKIIIRKEPVVSGKDYFTVISKNSIKIENELNVTIKESNNFDNIKNFLNLENSPKRNVGDVNPFEHGGMLIEYYEITKEYIFQNFNIIPDTEDEYEKYLFREGTLSKDIMAIEDGLIEDSTSTIYKGDENDVMLFFNFI